jgi:hypothetical protein
MVAVTQIPHPGAAAPQEAPVGVLAEARVAEEAPVAEGAPAAVVDKAFRSGQSGSALNAGRRGRARPRS